MLILDIFRVLLRSLVLFAVVAIPLVVFRKPPVHRACLPWRW